MLTSSYLTLTACVAQLPVPGTTTIHGFRDYGYKLQHLRPGSLESLATQPSPASQTASQPTNAAAAAWLTGLLLV